MGGYEIRRLDRGAGVGDFDCGEPELNEYLRRHAQRSQAAHFAVTYVAVRAGRTSRVLRSINAHRVRASGRDSSGSRWPKHFEWLKSSAVSECG